MAIIYLRISDAFSRKYCLKGTIKFSIQLTSVFSDEQNAVRRKEYFVFVTMNPEVIETSEFNTIDRKKFQMK